VCQWPCLSIGLIDCMLHWEWNNCLFSWKGMFKGKSGVPTVLWRRSQCLTGVFGISTLGLQGHWMILKSWTTFLCLFNTPVLQKSPASVHFIVNGTVYRYANWLGNGVVSLPFWDVYKALHWDANNVCVSTGGSSERQEASILYPDICLVPLAI
jgi:hypothetical protein